MLACPSCGADNPAGKRFCRQCGSGLGWTCPACGSTVDADDSFCGECGAALGETSPEPRQAYASFPNAAISQPTAERRLVSVLFADLVGFTTLSESRDPEEVRDLLSRYFDTCRTVISRYGGTVEKFIGDAVMAVWGAPVAQEDDAERAVRAALEVVQAVGALGAEVGALDLAARAGVATGEAAVSLGATGEGMVAGDLVNTASRIQSVATPGTVLVGEATMHATGQAVAYRETGTHSLKGKAEPVPLWQAERIIAGVGGALRSEGLEAPFVGRDRELRLIKELFHAAADDRTAHLVSVTGIAGIGKSRLAWEFYKYMDGLADTYRWHRGRSLAYGEGVAYWALAEMVRGRAEILEGEPPASAAQKLRVAVERHVPAQEDRLFVEPRLAHLIGLEELASPEREDLFAGWRLFFERMAEELPVVMSFEDCQWADAALLDFIEYMLEWSRGHPIFVLTMARPELAERRPSWGAGKRNFTSLYLEPLTRDSMGALLDGLVPGLPEQLTEQILDRAEGVPLYAVETVRMLLDRGLLRQEGSAYRMAASVDTLEVPESLHALIAARLDGLASQERRIVQMASVLGKTFTVNALATLSGTGEAELEPILASLVRKEVFGVQSDPRSPERGQYGFLQDLLRRVAYETLSVRDRRTLHLRVSEYLERAWTGDEDEIVEVLASHYVEAYRAAPRAEDAADIRAKARRLLTRAGDRAVSLAATSEARRYFKQALDLADEPVVQAELHEKAGRMGSLRGDPHEATGHLQQALDRYEALHDTLAAARVQAELAEVERFQGFLDRATDRMRRAYEALSAADTSPELATVAVKLGRLQALSGRAQEAVPIVEEALSLAQALGRLDLYAEGLVGRGLVLDLSGRADESAMHYHRAIEMAREHDRPSTLLSAQNNLGVVLEGLDRFDEQIRLHAEGLELARRFGNRVYEFSFLLGHLSALVHTGRWDEALELVSVAMGASEFSTLGWIAGAVGDVVPVHVHRGSLREARLLLDALAATEEDVSPEGRATWALATAVVLRATDDARGALAAAERAVQARAELGVMDGRVKRGLVEALEAAFDLADLAEIEELLAIIQALRPGELTPLLRWHGSRFAARLAALRGEEEGIEAAFSAAEAGFRALGTPFYLAVTLLEHGEWLAGQGRVSDAAPLLDEASSNFDELRARPWLDRLERASTSAVRT